MVRRTFACGVWVVLLIAVVGCRSEKPVAEKPATDEASTSDAAQAEPLQDEQPSAKADASPPPAPATTKEIDPMADLRTLAVRLIERDPTGGWRVSEQAALELEKRGPDAASELWPLLEDESAETRRGAAFYLLGRFNPNRPEQVDAYLRRLADEDDLVRSIALQATQQMRPADVAASQAQLTTILDPKHEPDAHQRTAVIRLLQRLKSEAAESAAALSKSAESDPDAKVRAAALVAIAQVAPSADTAEAAQKALGDTDPAVRLVAAVRLRQLGKEAATAADSLASALSDADERVRSAAAEALVKIGGESVPALIAQLKAEEVHARQLAVACLSRLAADASSALPGLKERLKDDDVTVRKLAELAIARIEAASGATKPAADPSADEEAK